MYLNYLCNKIICLHIFYIVLYFRLVSQAVLLVRAEPEQPVDDKEECGGGCLD